MESRYLLFTSSDVARLVAQLGCKIVDNKISYNEHVLKCHSCGKELTISNLGSTTPGHSEPMAVCTDLKCFADFVVDRKFGHGK